MNNVKINIAIFSITVLFALMAVNLDLVYKNLFKIGLYNGDINNVSFILENQWYLCESTEEGVLSLSKYDFPMVTYCNDDNGRIQFFPWKEKYDPVGEDKIVNNNKLTFLRYIESEDKVMFVHKKSMIVITGTPSNSIEDIDDIVIN